MAPPEYRDHGGRPFVLDIHDAAVANPNFRTTIWSGEHLQVTLMSILPGEDVGWEVHPDTDQFLRIEQGHGIICMRHDTDHPEFIRHIQADDAILVPAGYYHNLTNSGSVPLKLYSIYAPPHHPRGIVHRTKADAMEAEEEH